MKLTSIALLFGLVASPLLSQTTFVVGGAGQVAGSVPTITQALGSAVSGDTIKIKGMFSGKALGYCEFDHFGNGAEPQFPLKVPAGVTMEPYDSTPVYIWTVGSGGVVLDLLIDPSNPQARRPASTESESWPVIPASRSTRVREGP